MKNHEWVDGKLLQTNKKYSQLKLKQKEKIYQWMYEAYRDKYRELGKYPDLKDIDDILEPVMERIDEAEIWIPYGEVRKHFKGCMTQLRKRLNRENRTVPDETNTIEPLSDVFSVCKVSDYSGVDIDRPFVFTGRTDQEKSLVCPTDLVPDNTTDRDDGWRGFRIGAEIDFSLIGILARISKVLASNEVGIFAISTYNTDYVLVKEKDFRKALGALKSAGYRILDLETGTDKDGEE